MEKKTSAGDLVKKIADKLGKGLECTPLHNRRSIELRDLDPAGPRNPPGS